MSDARIPLVDLQWQHRQIEAQIMPRLEEAMAAGRFIGGPEVAAFESEFAAASGAAYCVGVANGTDALELALRAAGIERGDPVVLPANTFIATAEAVIRVGAEPVLVDCDRFHLIDVEQALTHVARAKAIVPVHLYGQLAPVEALAPPATEAGCVIVADAAQAQGATRNGLGIGAGVALAATSFYPGKNLGAYGDAGAVVTDDATLADAVRLASQHGSRERYVHEVMGVNSRLDALQAIVLREKLRRLEQWNAMRAAAAERYASLLDGLPVQTPNTVAGNAHVWHLYVVQVEDRESVLATMQADGVDAAVHYPTPVHLHPAAAGALGKPGDFPVAEAACASILSLPIYPGITEQQQERVVGSLRRALS